MVETLDKELLQNSDRIICFTGSGISYSLHDQKLGQKAVYVGDGFEKNAGISV